MVASEDVQVLSRSGTTFGISAGKTWEKLLMIKDASFLEIV